GAVEPLLSDGERYHPCPHRDCPVHSAQLCRAMCPPSENVGWRNCEFPQILSDQMQMSCGADDTTGNLDLMCVVQAIRDDRRRRDGSPCRMDARRYLEDRADLVGRFVGHHRSRARSYTFPGAKAEATS